MPIKPLFKIVLLLCLLWVTFLHSQNKQKVDSLTQLIQQDMVHDTVKVKTYNDLGIQYASSDPDLAKQYINRALNLATEIERPRGIAGAYNCLGIVDYYQKDYDSALINFQKALEINQKLEHLWGQAAALNQIGAVQNIKSDYNAAVDNFQQAGDIFKAMNDSLAWAKSIQNIGVSYSKMAHHQKAIEYYLKAIKLYKKINNPEVTAKVYISIATILYRQEDYKKSLEYLNEALPVVKNLSDNALLSVIKRKIGNNYSKLKDYNKALHYFQEALDYHKDGKNKKSIRLIKHYLGDIYYEMKEYDKALQLQKKALQQYDLSSNHKSRVRIHNSTSKTYVKLNQLREAASFATKALEISKPIGYLEGQKNAYHTLAMIAKHEGRNEKALQLYMDYQKFNDSLSVQENQQQVRELTTIYETEKRQVQIDAQQKDIALLDNQNKIKNYWILFGGTGLLAVFGFVMVIKSRNTAKRERVVQERFSHDLISAQENERNRVSKDLHDSVGQQLTFIKKKAQNSNQTDISELANTALEEVRTISRNLYPVTLKQLGLKESIEQLLLKLDEENPLFFSVEIDDINTDFNEEETLNVYRFIQESVSNVLKHSNAKTLIVNMLKNNQDVDILIKDNGQGFETTSAKMLNSLGLKTMKERIRILKGSFSIKSTNNVGTAITVKIPV